MISVLHVDDEEYFLELTRVFLGKEGDIRVEGVTSAGEALERLAGSSYDAIISDYRMPGMDGIAFLKRLRESGNATPFIILTGRGREQVAIEALNSGADFYLQKGTDPKVQFIELKNLVLQAVERHRTAGALRQSEERYRNLAEASRDLIYIIDREDRVVYVNRRAIEILGKPEEEVVGRPRAPLFSPDANESMAGNLARVFSTGEPVRIENRIPLGGKDSWQDTTLIPIRDREGAVATVMGISRDITRRKQIEDALRESEEKYRTLVERASDGIIVIQDGLMKFCNRRAAGMWGGECREVIGRPYREFVDPIEFPKLQKFYESRMAGREVPGRYDTRLLKRDGTSFPVDLNGGSISYEGRLADLIIYHDITDRKKAEEALRESEEKYRALVERANDGIVVVQDGIVKFCNRRAAEHWGGGVADIVGRPYQDFIDPVDASRIRENYERRIDGEKIPGQYDALLLRKDGGRFHAELNAGTLTYEGRPADLILFRDMTERRMAEDALKIANKKLNLLSSVTRHDMLNQLVVIVGYLELARESTSLGDARNLVDIAGKAAHTMRGQIEFTRQYQDVGVRSPIWQDLREVITRAVSGSARGNLDVRMGVGGIRIFADPLLERVFANLIENTMSHGGKATMIRFFTRETDAGLAIVCEDDGNGIPAHEKEQIFAPGYGRKTGYGLFLAREILAISGATIREIGKEGVGAVFEITVPKDACQRVG